MNLNETIALIRVTLQDIKIKKSGKNKHAGFEYYELSDFLPTLNELMKENGLNDRFTIESGLATLTLIKGDDEQHYSIPFEMFDVPLTKAGSPMMQQIQYLGALNTYYKRYLYLNAFGITDGEVIDSIDNSQLSKPKLSDDKFAEAVKYLRNNGKIETIEQKYDLTEKEKSALLDVADNG